MPQRKTENGKNTYRASRRARKRRGIGPLLPAVLCMLAVSTAVLLFRLRICGDAAAEPENAAGQAPDGQLAEVPYGSTTHLIVPDSRVERSLFTAEDFSADGQTRTCLAEGYTACFGVDVSSHQGAVDWAVAAGDGVEFALLRAGYRGHTEGELFADEQLEANLQGALESGLRVGVYWFSQALSGDEAAEEADYLTGLLEPYRDELTLPVYFDWEVDTCEDSRTRDADVSQVTGYARAFCDRLEEAGYETGIYFSRYMGYDAYDLSQFPEEKFWFAGEGDWPDFYYRVDCWQYCFEGEPAGFSKMVDLNLLLTKTEG